MMDFDYRIAVKGYELASVVIFLALKLILAALKLMRDGLGDVGPLRSSD